MKIRIRQSSVWIFLPTVFFLYLLILTTGGRTLVWSSYISIVLCFLFALIHLRKENILLVAGLLLTVCADTCLVLLDPIQQLWGMVFFFFAQSCYCIHLHRAASNRTSLWIRMALMIAAEVLCIFVLPSEPDALAIVSVAYYGHLIMNIADAIFKRKQEPLLPWAFVLFILCDTVIGLQVMNSSYLPLPEDSLIHDILYCGFNLAWFFYLPSQVLIALSSRTK